jgi:hypothetical protein
MADVAGAIKKALPLSTVVHDLFSKVKRYLGVL